ncbi:hypothetical protein [Kribbella koreensis]
MPDEEDLPPGPARDLSQELFNLYLRAGTPSTRLIAKIIADRDLAGALRRDAIREAIRGLRVPRWENLEALVVVLVTLQRTFHEQQQVDQVMSRINKLWLQAMSAQQTTSRRRPPRGAPPVDLDAPPPSLEPRNSDPEPTAELSRLIGRNTPERELLTDPEMEENLPDPFARPSPLHGMPEPGRTLTSNADSSSATQRGSEASGENASHGPSNASTSTETHQPTVRRILRPAGDSPGSPIDQLAKELDDLSRGRGIRAPDVGRRLGPGLTALLGYSDIDAMSQISGRRQQSLQAEIQTLLLDAAQYLPQETQDVFLASLSVTDEQELLARRLDTLGTASGRGRRTMIRRLREANRAVAQVLTRRLRPSSDTNPFAERGWFIDRIESHAAVGLHRIRLTTRSDVKFTHDGVKVLEESMFLNATADVTVEPLEGVDFLEVEQLSATVKRIAIHLPQSFHTAETYRYGLAATIPAEHFRPYNVLVPIRRTRSFHATVSFDSDVDVDKVWTYNGVLPPLIEDGAPVDPRSVAADHGKFVAAEWPTVRQGLAYGIGWSLKASH